jgi:hypothetical protein
VLAFLSGVVARVGTLEARCNVNVVEILVVKREQREREALVGLAREREKEVHRQDCSENCKEKLVSPKSHSSHSPITHLSRNTARWFWLDWRIARQPRTAAVGKLFPLSLQRRQGAKVQVVMVV